jgi:hypothetical protein
MATIWASRRPIRAGALRSNERTARISHLPCAPLERAHTENGLKPPTSRDPQQNSNARFVRAPFDRGFIAAIDLPADKIFSRILA